MAQTAAEGAAVLLKMLVRPVGPPHRLQGGPRGRKARGLVRGHTSRGVKAVGKQVRGTVNDVLLTAVCGALRRYLLLRGDRATGVEINAMVPVNLRPLEKPTTSATSSGSST